MHNFLVENQNELIERCTAKVAKRDKRAFKEEQLKNGIPLFLDQLIRTLAAENQNHEKESLQISGASGGDTMSPSEIGTSAAAHGKALLKLGFSVDQVVHNYGDLCQAITDLAFERDVPFAIGEFRTLNRCLDNAIADAVTEFSSQRDFELAGCQTLLKNQQMGILVHELRNSLGSAMLAVRALETGQMSITGATGAVLKRSLANLKVLIERAISEVRIEPTVSTDHSLISLAAFINEAKNEAELAATAKGCTLIVDAVDPLLGIEASPRLLMAALQNLLHNAIKFTHSHSQVSLKAYAAGDRILIDVSDHCGGLPPGSIDQMFVPFSQHGENRTGLGLGLAIARQNVEASRGTLRAHDVPGVGCVFTISLPFHALPELAAQPMTIRSAASVTRAPPVAPAFGQRKICSQ